MEPGRDRRWHLGNLGPAGPSPTLVTTVAELGNPTLPRYTPTPKAQAAGQRSALWTLEDGPPGCPQVPREAVSLRPRGLCCRTRACHQIFMHPTHHQGSPSVVLGHWGSERRERACLPHRPQEAGEKKPRSPRVSPLAKPCDFLPAAACPPQPGPPPTSPPARGCARTRTFCRQTPTRHCYGREVERAGGKMGAPRLGVCAGGCCLSWPL